MQVFFWSSGVTVALFFAIWAIVPLLFGWISLMLPESWFAPERPLWQPCRWEQNGRFYERVFRIKSWKHLLPDGGALFQKHGYKKRNLTDYSEGNLRRFLVESSRGELMHWVAISPFWVFGLFAPGYVVWIMLAYALAVNLPCILAQRYNRPRVYALLKRLYPNS
jgi:glycosyl-4,4'-diaponeurosporenoate acyltransferase